MEEKRPDGLLFIDRSPRHCSTTSTTLSNFFA